MVSNLFYCAAESIIKTVIPVTLGERKSVAHRIRYCCCAGIQLFRELMEFETLKCVLHLKGGSLPKKDISEIYEIKETTDGCFVSQTMLIDRQAYFSAVFGIRLGISWKNVARRSLNS